MQTTRTQTRGEELGGAPELAWILTIAHHPNPDYLGQRLVVASDTSVFFRRGDGAFDDERISREHAEVRAEPDGDLWIRDCGSRNGTEVNGSRIERRGLLEGDVVGVGKMLFFVHRGPVVHSPAPHSSEHWEGVGVAHRRVLEQIAKVAARDTLVCVQGPSGAGKTSVARLVHEQSGRRGDLVLLHCGSLFEEALHSQLFGHDKGAFPGATSASRGLVASAAGGTLLLDDVGAASKPLQRALLAFLDTREARAVGSAKTRQLDVRIVATTTEPLEELVRDDRLEVEFAQRLSGFTVEVPGLAERRDDIGFLVHRFARELSSADVRIDPHLVLYALQHSWEGNIRELHAFVEEAIVESDGSETVSLPSRNRDELRLEPAEARVARSGSWFQVRGEDRVDIGHRRNLARLLARLVEHWQRSPGVALTLPELFEAGWPGERPQEKSAANRVYVALTTLRRLGLRSVIERERDGYRVPTAVRLEIADG